MRCGSGRRGLPGCAFSSFGAFCWSAWNISLYGQGFRVLAGPGSSSLDLAQAAHAPQAEQGRPEQPMKRLYLLRHAKAAPADPAQDDHGRELTVRGMHDADAMARYLRKNGFVPDLMLVS